MPYARLTQLNTCLCALNGSLSVQRSGVGDEAGAKKRQETDRVVAEVT